MQKQWLFIILFCTQGGVLGDVIHKVTHYTIGLNDRAWKLQNTIFYINLNDSLEACWNAVTWNLSKTGCNVK